jgi:hypothetical protein
MSEKDKVSNERKNLSRLAGEFLVGREMKSNNRFSRKPASRVCG